MHAHIFHVDVQLHAHVTTQCKWVTNNYYALIMYGFQVKSRFTHSGPDCMDRQMRCQPRMVSWQTTEATLLAQPVI